MNDGQSLIQIGHFQKLKNRAEIECKLRNFKLKRVGRPLAEFLNQLHKRQYIMRKYVIFLILFSSIVYSQDSKDTIILDNVLITPFIKDENFIKNKGKSNVITVHSDAGIITQVNLKSDIKLRAIEFFFNPSTPKLCQEFTAKVLLYKTDSHGKFISLTNSPETYYFIDSTIVSNKIFDLRDNDILLKKNTPYFIGLYFSPAGDCLEFQFQGFRKKKVKSFIGLDFKNNSRITEINDYGIAYRIFYE